MQIPFFKKFVKILEAVLTKTKTAYNKITKKLIPRTTKPSPQAIKSSPKKIDSADWPGKFSRFLSNEKDASVYTQRNYKQALDEFEQWYRDTNESPVRWSELVRNDFRLFLRQLGRKELSQPAIRLRFSALSSFYKFLMQRGLVESSPVKDVTLPKPAKRLPQFLTIDQMNALLDAPLQELSAKRGTKKKVSEVPYLRDRAILETIYSCGLRIGEMCEMLAGEIEPDDLVVNVHGKGKKERQVPIGRVAIGAIHQYWERLAKPPTIDEPVFFSNEKGRKKISPRLVQLRLKKYLTACGLDPTLTPHKLRHSYATHMLDAGADLRSVQEMLGHANLTSTQVYTHVTTERIKQAYDEAHPRA